MTVQAPQPPSPQPDLVPVRPESKQEWEGIQKSLVWTNIQIKNQNNREKSIEREEKSPWGQRKEG